LESPKQTIVLVIAVVASPIRSGVRRVARRIRAKVDPAKTRSHLSITAPFGKASGEGASGRSTRLVARGAARCRDVSVEYVHENA
jgi:hypothetical protein